MKPFAIALVLVWGVPGAILATLGEKGMEQLIVNTPLGVTILLICGAFLKHMAGMNKGRNELEGRVINALNANTEALTTLRQGQIEVKDEIKELRKN